MEIIRSAECDRFFKQGVFFQALSNHELPLVSVSILSYHIQVQCYRGELGSVVNFRRLNQTRVIDDQLQMYDASTIKQFYDRLSKDLIGGKASKRNRKKTGHGTLVGVSHLATQAEASALFMKAGAKLFGAGARAATDTVNGVMGLNMFNNG